MEPQHLLAIAHGLSELKCAVQEWKLKEEAWRIKEEEWRRKEELWTVKEDEWKNKTEKQKERKKIVELNVGGKKFSTTRETLLSHHDTYFSALLSGHFQVRN